MVPRGARYGRSASGRSRRSSQAAMFGMQMLMRYVKFAAAIIQMGSPMMRKTMAVPAVSSVAA